MSLSDRCHQVIQDFSSCESWEQRYKKVMLMGKELEETNECFLTDKYKVKGCQSQVWLIPSLSKGQVIFQADSDAVLVKGIIALLVKVYSGSTPQEILEHSGDFLKELGITEHLSMNRSNGLSSMMKQIKMYALAFKTLTDKGVQDVPAQA